MNKNHDPKSGKFSSGSGGRSVSRQLQQRDRIKKKLDQHSPSKTPSPSDQPRPGHVFAYHATTPEAAQSITTTGFRQSMSPVQGMKNSVYFYPQPHSRNMELGHNMAFEDAPMHVVRGEIPIAKAVKIGDPTNPHDTGAFYIVEAADIASTAHITNPKAYAEELAKHKKK